MATDYIYICIFNYIYIYIYTSVDLSIEIDSPTRIKDIEDFSQTYFCTKALSTALSSFCHKLVLSWLAAWLAWLRWLAVWAGRGGWLGWLTGWP